jgi:hypothetical protein
MLFGVIILIGTGYTFFKGFLTPRERNLFMIVLPLQVIDNIAMIILEESDFSDKRYLFWFEVFTAADIFCCAIVLFPIVWSISHLKQAAMTDGKKLFNLEKLKLFQKFYIIVICYIYASRMGTFILDLKLPFDQKWIAEASSELITLAFFIVVGVKFKPVRSNPYLKLTQTDSDAEDGEAITMNGLYENVVRVNRVSVQNEIDELIPGSIAGLNSESEDEEEDDSLLPKISR